jgi:hypothetical protein
MPKSLAPISNHSNWILTVSTGNTDERYHRCHKAQRRSFMGLLLKNHPLIMIIEHPRRLHKARACTEWIE